MYIVLFLGLISCGTENSKTSTEFNTQIDTLKLHKKDKVELIERETPIEGYIPNKETAKKVAEAICLPIYGETILKQKPYNAELISDSIWHIYGTFNEPTSISENQIVISFGGVFEIWFLKSNGKILKVTHGE